MIYKNYVDQYGLVDAIHAAGHTLHKLDNDIIVDDLAAVKLIVKRYDPLPVAREDARQLIQDASREKRAQYVSDLPGKALEYDTKYQEAIEYQHNRSVGTYMKKRIQYTREKPSCIAKEWKQKGQWAFEALSTISAIYDKALFDMQRERDYAKMRVIAKEAIELIKGVG